MKLTPQTIALLAGSIIIDAVQGFVLFNAALCAVPSITGVGALLTAVCAIAGVGIVALGAIFTLLWGLMAYGLTGERLMVGAGIAESIPGLNGLPIFTAATVYYIVR